MTGRSLPGNVKRASVLRRVPPFTEIRYRRRRGNEGDICAFQLPSDASSIVVEAPTGRLMEIAPGDIFLATPGSREATRSVAGILPIGGLVPDDHYWVLAGSGVVGELVGISPFDEDYVGRVRYLGAICGSDGKILNIRQFAVRGSSGTDYNAPVYLIVGTSGDAGKTTAGIAILRALRLQGHTKVIALKTTGSASFAELARYQDFGASEAFDCLDFGLPGTHPLGRKGLGKFLSGALDFCLSLPADAVIVECGGDLAWPTVLEFLTFLKIRRSEPKVVLAAIDALGAMAAKQILAEHGLSVSLITGPCTDTPTLRERTYALCGVPAMNLHRNQAETEPGFNI
jgi:hypothetical protein